MREMFELYVNVKKLNDIVKNAIEHNPTNKHIIIGGSYYSLSIIKDNKGHYHLYYSTVTNGKLLNFTTKLGKSPHLVNRAVVNRIRSVLVRHFNGSTVSRYQTLRYRDVENQLSKMMVGYLKERESFSVLRKLKTDREVIRTHYAGSLESIKIEAEFTNKLKIFRDNIKITIKVYFLNTLSHTISFSVSEKEKDILGTIVKKLREHRTLL